MIVFKCVLSIALCGQPLVCVHSSRPYIAFPKVGYIPVRSLCWLAGPGRHWIWYYYCITINLDFVRDVRGFGWRRERARIYSILSPKSVGGLLDVSKVFLELLEEDEGDDGVRPQPDEGRNVALVEGQGAALAEREADQVQGA